MEARALKRMHLQPEVRIPEPESSFSKSFESDFMFDFDSDEGYYDEGGDEAVAFDSDEGYEDSSWSEEVGGDSESVSSFDFFMPRDLGRFAQLGNDKGQRISTLLELFFVLNCVLIF